MKGALPYLSVLLLVVVLAGGTYVFWSAPLDVPLNKEDIYYDFLEGQRILQGQNPYARILTGDLFHNQYYPTYFPVFYEMSYLAQLSGKVDFEVWVQYWRYFFFATYLGVAAIFFSAHWKKGAYWLGLFASVFWLFNRWTLQVISSANFDFLPILCLVISLVLFSKNRSVSLLFLSLSLGLKQIAIFLVPLYLIWVWRDAMNKQRELLVAGLIIASVPFLASLPFLFWSFEGFYKSLLFSATRLGSTSFGVPSLDVVFGLMGFRARGLMLLLMSGIYLVALIGGIRKYSSAAFIFTIFASFNAVLYVQYILWWTSATLLTPLDYVDELTSNQSTRKKEV